MSTSNNQRITKEVFRKIGELNADLERLEKLGMQQRRLLIRLVVLIVVFLICFSVFIWGRLNS